MNSAQGSENVKQELAKILDQDDLKKIAEQLFTIISAEYLKFSFETAADKTKFAKFKKIMGDYHNNLNAAVMEKVMHLIESNPAQGVKFATQLIQELIQLGDTHSASAVQFALNEVAYKKQNRGKPEFSDSETKLMDESLIANLDYSKTLSGSALTVPYFGAFGRAFDNYKESEGLEKNMTSSQEKTRQLIKETQRETHERRETIKQRQESMQLRELPETKMLNKLKKYIDGYALNKSREGQKKHHQGKVLFNILMQNSLDQNAKIKALQDYVKQAPAIHQGKHNTLEKMAKEFLNFYEQQAAQLEKEAKRSNLQQAKALFTQQLQASSVKPKPAAPAVPSRKDRRSLSEPAPVKSSWEKTNTPSRPRRNTQTFLFSKDRHDQQTDQQKKDAAVLKANQTAPAKMQKNTKVSALVHQFESGIFSRPDQKGKTTAGAKKANPDSPHHRSRKPR